MKHVDERVFNALCHLFEGNKEGYASLSELSRATGLSRCSIVNSIKRLILKGCLKKFSDFSPETGYLKNYFVID
jgi:predicted transcriptional regulator